MKRTLLVVVALLFLASCKGEGNAYEVLVKADRKQLLNDARALQARYVKPSEEVPRSAWPASIAAFHPEKVTVDQWGVWVQTDSFFVDARGLYIRTDTTYPPPRRGEIEANFSWYISPPV